LLQQVDREKLDHYSLRVKAGYPSDESTASIALVNIVVDDVNDNIPQPEGGMLQVYLCENDYNEFDRLEPPIRMVDLDGEGNGAPFKYFDVKNQPWRKDFQILDNHDSTASVIPLHERFSSSEQSEYEIPFAVRDAGNPAMNATHVVVVHVCTCSTNHEGEQICAAMAAASFPIGIMFILISCLFISLICFIILVLVRRSRRHRSDRLLKGSLASDDVIDDDVRENIFNCDVEGGGEEDTAAFDIHTLKRDYNSTLSRSHVRSISSAYSGTPPSTKLCSLPPYSPPQIGGVQQEVGDFITSRKLAEDNDDRKLAFDSLQIYAYEGEGSDAGSLSSLNTGTDDSEDQNYDHLFQWGPRFQKLANIYGGNDS